VLTAAVELRLTSFPIGRFHRNLCPLALSCASAAADAHCGHALCEDIRRKVKSCKAFGCRQLHIRIIEHVGETVGSWTQRSNGAEQLSMSNRGDDAPAVTNVTSWVNLPGWDVSVNGESLINARFTAESLCDGDSGTCTVRIIAQPAVGPPIELNPSSGTDFAFDSVAATDDGAEAHAMERSRRLEGNYTIRVQYGVTNAATTFTLDDWHFAVEESA
jgi:hypothetical protein